MNGEELRRTRWARGFTIRDLANASGVSEDTITKLENGRREGRGSTLRKLEDALSSTYEGEMDPEKMVEELRAALRIKDWPSGLEEAHPEAKWMYMMGLVAGRSMTTVAYSDVSTFGRES